MKLAVVLMSALAFAAPATAQEGQGQVVEQTDEQHGTAAAKGPAAADDDCAMGGYKPGQRLTEEQFKAIKKHRENPSVWKPEKGKSYLVAEPGAYQQYIAVSDLEVIAVVREFDGDNALKVQSALRQKYGDPINGNLVPQMKMAAAPFFSSMKMVTRTLYRSRACAQDIEYVSQQKVVAAGMGAGGGLAVAVVVTKSSAQGAEGDLLK